MSGVEHPQDSQATMTVIFIFPRPASDPLPGAWWVMNIQQRVRCLLLCSSDRRVPSACSHFNLSVTVPEDVPDGRGQSTEPLLVPLTDAVPWMNEDRPGEE